MIGDVDTADVKKMFVQELLAVCNKIHTCNPDIKVNHKDKHLGHEHSACPIVLTSDF